VSDSGCRDGRGRVRGQILTVVMCVATLGCAGSDDQQQASPAASPAVEPASAALVPSRDMTPGDTWIERLDRSDRPAGLRVDDVIASLGLEDGVVIADIGAGTGAFTIPFARAVGPSGRVLAVEIWPELLDLIAAKAGDAGADNVVPVLCQPDDPMLPAGEVDIAFFHDVFHNVPDRQAYLERLASYLKPGGRIAIIEQKYDDPIAMRWDIPEDRITPDQIAQWMNDIGFRLAAEFDLFQGDNNPSGTGMPERWFVVYAREDSE